jgi:ankyrin repeat protein
MEPDEFVDLFEKGPASAIRCALDADPTLVRRSECGNFGIHFAAWQGNGEIVQLLLDRGADVNARGDGGRTALHYAIEHDHPNVVQLLVSRGADVNVVDDERGLSAMACAAREFSAPDFPELGESFRILQAAGAIYDLNAAGWRADIDRVREILAANRQAAKTVSSPDYLLADVVISEWGSPQAKIEILDLLFSHEFRRPQSELEVLLVGRTGPVVDHLRNMLSKYV